MSAEAHDDIKNGSALPRRWHFAGILLDERSLELRVRGAIVRVPRKSLMVLLHLLQHAGEVVTKDELADACWPRRVLSDTVLTTTLARLRQALGDEQQELIKTVHGFGYRLVGAVKVESSGSEPEPRLELKHGDHPPLRPSWTLIERLGAGGSGEVWLARHEQTSEKRVYKFAVDAAALKGIKREVTLFRLLKDDLGERADLTQILDWNLESAPFYIESEYIAGGNLRQWSDVHGGLSNVALGTRLELIAQCADTLAAAHSIGVLHKDLKPSNVLVFLEADAAPRIKLCDFGSGAVLDTGRLHHFGITQRGFTTSIFAADAGSGTPLYLPPEAHLGQPMTAQSDIYALGVMLYQAVIGDWNRPLSAGWEREVPDEMLRADIAAAVDGDPTRRLPNAGELALRLRQLDARRARIEEERVQAARVLELQKTLERSQLRRRWVTITATLLAVGLISTLGLYVKLLHSERQRETALQLAQAAVLRAESESKRSLVTKDFLVSVFRANDPRVASLKSRGTLSARELLDIAAERIKREFAADPETQIELLSVAASIFDELGEHDRYAALHADYTALAGTQYGELSPIRINALMDAADHEIRYGDIVKQRALLNQVDTLIHRAALDESSLRGRWWVLMDVDNEPTPADSQRALRNAQELLTPADHGVYYRMLNYFASDALGNHDFAAAEKYSQQSIDLITADGSYHDDYLLGNAFHALGLAQDNQGNLRAAGENYKKAMDLALQTYGYSAKTMAVIAHYASLLHGRGERSASMELFDKLWSAVPTVSPADLENYLSARASYATCLIDEGRPAPAIPILEEVQRYVMLNHDADLAAVSSINMWLGTAYLQAGRTADGERVLKLALERSTKHLPADDGDVLDARVAWSEWLLSRNEIGGAQAQFQQIIDHAKDSHLYYAALANGGFARAALKRHDVASALDRSAMALKIIDTFLELHDERFRPYLWDIRAQALLAAGDPKAATKWARRAVEADRRFDDANSGALRQAQKTLLLAQRDPATP